MEAHLVKQNKYFIVTRGESKEKFGIALDMRDLTNAHVIRAGKLVQKLIVKVLQAMDEDVRFPFAIVHSCLWVEYLHQKPDSIHFPLSYEEDYVPDEVIESFLNESTDLDEDYFNIGEKEFKPIFNEML